MIKDMALKKLILWLLALTVCVVGGALIWAFQTDLGRFQPRIEAFLSEQLDRETRFDDLSIDLGSSIEIRAIGFRIANVPGATQPNFVHIPSLEGAVTLASLFDAGPLVIERLEADGVEVNLAWDENGNGNFKLGKPRTEPPPPQPPINQRYLSLLQSRLTDASLTLSWPTHVNRFDFATLEVADQPGDRVTLSFDGAINGNPMTFSGHATPRQELLRAGAVSIEGEGRFAGLSVDGKAEFDSLARPDRPLVQLDVQGEDVREIEEFLGIEPGEPGTYQLLLDSALDQGNWTADLRGHVGEVTFDANGEASGLQDLTRFGLNIHSRGPDMGQILRLFRLDHFREEPFEVKGRVVRDGPNVRFQDIDMDLGATRFDLNGTLRDFPHLRGAQMELEVRGEDIESFRDILGLPGAADGPFALDLAFEPNGGSGEGGGRFDRMTVQLSTNLGMLALNGEVSDHERYAGSILNIDVDGLNAADSLGTLGLPGLEPGPFSVDGRIEVREQGVAIEQSRVSGLYGVKAEATGLVGWKPLEADTSLAIELTGEDLERTLTPLGVEWTLASASFALTSGLRATPAGIRLDDLVLAVAQSRLEANALIPLTEDLAGLDVTLQAQGPELGNIFRPGEALDVPPGAWSIASHLRRVDGRLIIENTRIALADLELIGEATLPWPFEAGNGSFKVDGQGRDITTVLPRLGTFDLAPQGFSLSAEAQVEQGTWRLQPSTVRLGGASFAISGTADRLPDYSKTDLDIDLEIPSLAALGTWRGEALNDARFAIRSRLDGNRNRVSAEPLRITTGDSEATGNLVWDTGGELPYLELVLRSDRLDLRPVLPKPAGDQPDPQPEDAVASDERLIPDTPLPLDWLDKMEASLDLEIGQVLLHDRLLNDLTLNARLESGLLVIAPYRIKGKTGEFDVTGQLSRRADGQAEMVLDFNATDLLPAREDWQNADPATLPKINAMMELRAVGATPRDLAATLNGRAWAVASEGVLPGNGLGALNTYFLEQILSILVPGLTAQEPTTLKCFAANVVIQDGVLKPEPLVALSTDKLLILTAGSIDLRNERLNLDFQTTPSKLLGASLAELVNPFVSIRGTLANPTPLLDPGKTLVYGGAAAATGGLSIVAKGLWDRLRGAQKPCEQLRDSLNGQAQSE